VIATEARSQAEFFAGAREESRQILDLSTRMLAMMSELRADGTLPGGPAPADSAP